MKDFLVRNKIFIGVVLATLALLIGGVYIFSKSGQNQPNAINADILVPKDAEVTGGISNGVHLPANSNVKVTLVEFGDFQCPACGAYNQLTTQLLTDFNGKINFAFRDFAFIGSESTRASEAAYCAGDQNKYWEFHDYLYSHQQGENKGNFSDDNLKNIAKNLNLDIQKFNQCFDSSKYSKRVSDSTNSGNLIGITSTPSFFINGVKIEPLPGSYEGLKSLVQDALNSAPVPSGSATPSYHVHFDIKTYISGSPINFSLAKYQDSDTNKLDENIHFHDGNGNIVHVHKMNASLSELFTSLKISFPADTKTNNLKVYVNGNLNPQALNYIPQDLDRVLVSYGPVNDTNIQKQISIVSNNSCIYSLKCPERGTPPPESCAGGLGTGCSD